MIPVYVLAPLSVSAPAVNVKPPVPLITPEYVPLALLKTKLLPPKTTPPAPLNLTILTAPFEPLISKVPAFTTELLAIEPAPDTFKLEPLLIVVEPL